MAEFKTKNVPGGVAITKIISHTTGTELTIPTEIDGKAVKSVERCAFHIFESEDSSNDIYQFNKVVIPEGIELRPLSFDSASVKEVYLPRSVVKVPGQCFLGSCIEKIVFEDPSSVEEIGWQAFANCGHLKHFSWPSGCKTLNACFSGSGLTSIDGIENITCVKNDAFAGTQLAEIKWPSKCEIIPEGCFKGSVLQKISGIENVVSVGEEAFAITALLKRFDWPKKCKVIPKSCFHSSGIKEISGIENVEKIERQAFAWTNRLVEFKWPSKCHTIPAGCFDSSIIEQISGIEDVQLIGPSAFSNTRITEFVVPIKCKRLDKYTFERCSLRRLTILAECFEFDLFCLPKKPLDELDISACSEVKVMLFAGPQTGVVPDNWKGIRNIKTSFDTNITMIG